MSDERSSKTTPGNVPGCAMPGCGMYWACICGAPGPAMGIPVLGSTGYISAGGAAAGGPNEGVKLLAAGLNENSLALALSFVVGFFFSSSFSAVFSSLLGSSVVSFSSFLVSSSAAVGVTGAGTSSPFSFFFSSFFSSLGVTTAGLTRPAGPASLASAFALAAAAA